MTMIITGSMRNQKIRNNAGKTLRNYVRITIRRVPLETHSCSLPYFFSSTNFFIKIRIKHFLMYHDMIRSPPVSQFYTTIIFSTMLIIIFSNIYFLFGNQITIYN
jgi:hypothetical protein